MKVIADIVEQINDEINDAKDYAEKYLVKKADGDNFVASRYKEMSEDELKHSTYLHELVEKEIEKYRQVYTPPAEMLDKWNKVHQKYIKKVDVVKQMLVM